MGTEMINMMKLNDNSEKNHYKCAPYNKESRGNHEHDKE